MSLIFEAPVSSLSFGQVSYNILREFWKRNLDIGFFPIGNIDLSCFEPKKEFVDWLQDAANKRYSFLKRDVPSLKLWHILSTDTVKTDMLRTPRQTLLTFYECSEPTEYEKSIIDLQYQTLFSSNYACDKFFNSTEKSIAVGTFFCGFDPDFYVADKKYFQDKVVFGLFGKYENRKATKQIIQAWVKRYGNNPKYVLNLLVNNPFFSPEDNQNLLNQAFGGRRFHNVNILPHLATNKEVCELLNATDIDLSGLSNGEGWNLGAFNTTALGRWSIVSNHTSHKDWATKDNSILVEPDGTIPVYDGVFFRPESPVNHGVFYTLSEEKMIAAFEEAEKKAGEINKNGLNLQTTHSWEKAVDGILANI